MSSTPSPSARQSASRFSDGRGALELGPPVGDLFGGEVEIVRARLGAQGNAVAFGGAQRLQRVAGGVVNDVRARARLAAESRGERDGFVLPGARSRQQIGGVGARISRGPRGHRTGHLGVHQEGRADAPELLHGGAEVALAHPPELADPRIDEEALEPEHARLGHGPELARVARHHAAPEADVDPALPARGRALLRECLQRRRHGDRVERHVDQRGDASRRGALGGGAEAFPLGAARLVDVHVRVDDAGHYHRVAVVDRAGRVVHQAGDAARLDDHAGRPQAFGGEHPLAADGLHRSRTTLAAPHPSNVSTAKTCQLYSLP
jgi:hypothetical protein